MELARHLQAVEAESIAFALHLDTDTVSRGLKDRRAMVEASWTL